MTKSELIACIAERNPHLFQRDVERIVSTIFDEISAALSRGDRVELRGFGAFSVKHRDSRIGRNPRTGEAVSVAEKAVAHRKVQNRSQTLVAVQRVDQLEPMWLRLFLQQKRMHVKDDILCQDNESTISLEKMASKFWGKDKAIEHKTFLNC